MIKFMLCLGCIGAGCLAAGAAWAGPNANGVLLLHAQPESEVSHTEFCGIPEIDDPADATTEVQSLAPHIVWVLAAFPRLSVPVLKGINFGIDYDPNQIAVVNWRTCAEVQLTALDWPSPGSGVSLVFQDIRRQPVNDLAWFVAYAYDSAPTSLRLQGHPTQDGVFADDSVPSKLDPIVDYSELGFFRQGQSAFPPNPFGGCCLGGDVFVMTEGECAEHPGSVYLPNWLPGDEASCFNPVLDVSWGEVKERFMD